jgi:hypothetical protein
MLDSSELRPVNIGAPSFTRMFTTFTDAVNIVTELGATFTETASTFTPTQHPQAPVAQQDRKRAWGDGERSERGERRRPTSNMRVGGGR